MSASILIVNYRVYEALDRALASLDPFLRSGDEVVVLDQESDARHLAVVAQRHARVTFVPSERNVGFAAGANRAAQRATTPYLALLNPDATVEGPTIDVLERWLEEHQDTAVVAPRVLNEDGSVQASARRFPGLTTAIAGRSTWLTSRFPGNWLSARELAASRATGPVDVDWVAGSCFMTRRDVFERLGGFDERFFMYWEDADFCRRATRLGLRCVYLPTADVRHTGGRSAAADPASAIRAFHESASYLYWKHTGSVGRLFAPIVRAALRLRGMLHVRLVTRRVPRG